MLKPFFVWQDKVLKRIHPEDVSYLCTEGNYTKIFFADGKTKVQVRSTLSGALKKLPPEIFIKTHRSYAASIYFIDSIARDHLTVGEDSIPIARQYHRSVGFPKLRPQELELPIA